MTRGVQGIRNKTLKRAFDVWWSWFSRAIGMPTAIYILVSVGLLGFGAFDDATLLTQHVPLQTRAGVVLGILGLWYLIKLTNVVPPFFISQRDAIRLGFSPAKPIQTLTYPMWFAGIRDTIVLIGVGLLWSMTSWKLLNFVTPYAVLNWVLLGLLVQHLGWLKYRWQEDRRATLFPVLLGVFVLGSLVSLWFPEWSFLGSLMVYSPLPCLLLAVLLGITIWQVVQDLQEDYPASFLQHSTILSEIRAVDTLLIFALGSMAAQAAPDLLVTKRKLQMTLRPSNTHARTVPVPKDRQALRMIAWRTTLGLYRQSWTDHLVTLVGLVLTAYAVDLLVSQPDKALIVGAIPIVAMGLFLPRLVPSTTQPTWVPVPREVRAIGQILPGIVISVVVYLILSILGPLLLNISVPVMLVTLTLAPLYLLALEALNNWTRLGTQSTYLKFGAGLLAVVPAVILLQLEWNAFVIPGQVLLAFIFYGSLLEQPPVEPLEL
ncbi:hypothetical protein [Deinococcus cellulosilyticus]|uniref:Uncharacterized protein n=1 Tax=Deinococcus cellulosilyticus (strain DSM 18568 / NBRC 106333 / KACC 11606 / 5516J-15) TaxID=1223518 RepID=A0A511MWC5_DEIC1|nr:hypothetical protein [Deinococcus cellulosilyticus]GEM44884.1 hypothetical protein DC3_05190 [Deinococcus cellulosilyticus NBRC 106333 = KACC 11606]